MVQGGFVLGYCIPPYPPPVEFVPIVAVLYCWPAPPGFVTVTLKVYCVALTPPFMYTVIVEVCWILMGVTALAENVGVNGAETLRARDETTSMDTTERMMQVLAS